MDFDENAHAETEYTNWRLQLGLKMLVRLEASVLLESAIIRWKNRFQNKHHKHHIYLVLVSIVALS